MNSHWWRYCKLERDINLWHLLDVSEAPEDPAVIFVWTMCNVKNYTRRKSRWLFWQWWELQTCKCSSVNWPQAAKCSIEGKQHSAAWGLLLLFSWGCCYKTFWFYSKPRFYKWAFTGGEKKKINHSLFAFAIPREKYTEQPNFFESVSKWGNINWLQELEIKTNGKWSVKLFY